MKRDLLKEQEEEVIRRYQVQNWKPCSLYLINFGKSIMHSRIGGQEDRCPKVEGNLLFSTVNAFKGSSPSRRDDIIQIFYTMIFMLNVNDGWVMRSLANNNSYEWMKNFKLTATTQMLSKPVYLRRFCQEAHSYQ